jgi:uncharacterized protein
MKLEGDYLFEATVAEVWSALFDPVILAAVMPGCEKLDLVDGQYVGEIKVKVGPIQGKFTGKVDLKDKDEPHSYTMIVDGRGAPGFVKATAGVKLSAEGSSTRVHYDTDAQIGGKIASVGQRLIEASARAIVAQSLEGLHTNIKLRAAAYREAAAKQTAAPLAEPLAEQLPRPPEPAALPEPAASASPSADAATSSSAGAAAAPVTAASPAIASSPGTSTESASAAPSSASPSPSSASPSPSAASPSLPSAAPSSASPSTPSTPSPVPAAAIAAPSRPAASTPVPAVAFTPIRSRQSDLANAVAKEVASSLFPRSVLVAIIVVQAIVIIWLLVRS